MLSCQFYCEHCKRDMISIANGITYCENCGKLTSNFAPMIIPEMSAIIFRAKKSAGGDVPEGKMKIHYGWKPDSPPTLKIVRDEDLDGETEDA